MHKTVTIITVGSLLAAVVATIFIFNHLFPSSPDDQSATGDAIKKTAAAAASSPMAQAMKAAASAVGYDPSTGAIPTTLDQANQVLVQQYISTSITQAQIDAANKIVNSANASAAFGPTS